MVTSAVRVIARAIAGSSFAGTVLGVAALDVVEAIFQATSSALSHDLKIARESYVASIQAKGIAAAADARLKVANAVEAENRAIASRASRRSREELDKFRKRMLKGRLAAEDFSPRDAGVTVLNPALKHLFEEQASLRIEEERRLIEEERRHLEDAIRNFLAKGGSITVGKVTVDSKLQERGALLLGQSLQLEDPNSD